MPLRWNDTGRVFKDQNQLKRFLLTVADCSFHKAIRPRREQLLPFYEGWEIVEAEPPLDLTQILHTLFRS